MAGANAPLRGIGLPGSGARPPVLVDVSEENVLLQRCQIVLRAAVLWCAAASLHLPTGEAPSDGLRCLCCVGSS